VPWFGAVVAGLAASVGPAAAYTASGDRDFPATLQLPQIAPSDEFYVDLSSLPLDPGAAGGTNRTTGVAATYAKTITDRLGVVIREGYSAIGQDGVGTQYGWQNLQAEIKYLAIDDADHEFLSSLGLGRETGGTGAGRVGASFSGATTPRIYFGKGLGDLDVGYLRPLAISGVAGLQLADAAPRPDLANAGVVVEYSIPYLQSKVHSFDLPNWARRLTPMTEIVFTAPAGRSYGARATALIAPGVSYAGEGWEFGIEALVPASRATGRGVGATAQFHLALDFLFSDSIGKPLFSER
jgi:hypothetical protein